MLTITNNFDLLINRNKQAPPKKKNGFEIQSQNNNKISYKPLFINKKPLRLNFQVTLINPKTL